MKLERWFGQHEEMVASNAESVLLLIEAGRSPDTRQAADMIGVPVEYLEHELETQTLHQFMRRCAKRRR
jgi:hypothetical protein